MRAFHLRNVALITLIITSVAPGTSLATPLAVVNGGFEDPILNSGESQPFPSYGPTDWYPYEAGGGWFSVRGGTTIIHPDEELFSNGAAEGNNAARLSVFPQPSIYQVIEDLQPESRYHLQVDVGNSFTETFNASGGLPFLYRIGLSLRSPTGRDFGYPLAYISDELFPSDGNWGTVDLWYDSPTQAWIDENWFPGVITSHVLVLSIDTLGGIANRSAVYVDNVRLSITPVPETSTLALTSIGVGIAALLMGRRRRKLRSPSESPPTTTIGI